ncbi:hypothetical protein AVEN_171300-1 [Araneus ventricosus]|uniref:Uncharacterized protein n=1 Tax=Araneus ventricosus TaxID=182803 RepID=A0A4Y2KGV8_ARAVE|nr:hypothetical protein AVEN_171300-1 [Araneus ventricosus]
MKACDVWFGSHLVEGVGACCVSEVCPVDENISIKILSSKLKEAVTEETDNDKKMRTFQDSRFRLPYTKCV